MEPSSPAPRPKRYFRRIVVSLVVVVALIILLVPALTWLYTHDRHVGFQTYKPQQLPAGYSVKRATIYVWSKRETWGYTKQLTLALSKNHGYISEEKNQQFNYTCTAHVINQTCTVRFTPQHQKYLDKVSYDSQTGKPFDETVALLKGNTYIWMGITSSTPLPASAWATVIDSLQPYHFSNLPVVMTEPGP